MTTDYTIPPPNRNRQKVALGAVGVAAAVVALSGPMISKFEGTITATYRDPVGILTSCVGHVGPELRMGQKFTPAQCQVQFDGDQKRILRGMEKCSHAPQTLPVWAAMESFSFNGGYGLYCKNFAPMLDRGDVVGACNRLSLYIKGRKNGQLVILPGLVNRRVKERSVCLSGAT